MLYIRVNYIRLSDADWLLHPGSLHSAIFYCHMETVHASSEWKRTTLCWHYCQLCSKLCQHNIPTSSQGGRIVFAVHNFTFIIMASLLFIIFTNSIFKTPLSSNAKLALYTDDIALYKPIDSDSDTQALQNVVSTMQLHTDCRTPAKLYKTLLHIIYNYALIAV